MLKATVCFSRWGVNKVLSTRRSSRLLTVLLFVEVFNAVTGRVVIAEVRFVYLFIELGLVVPHFALKDVNYDKH